jgi:ABC transporter
MIELHGLTKRYGPTLALDDLSFRVQPGKVTGFLGPNGAGKSTSMRMVLGVDRPTAGHALVDGGPYRELRAPLRVVGALLDAGAVHPRRSARDHLGALARSNGIGRSRVEEVLGLVGLEASPGGGPARTRWGCATEAEGAEGRRSEGGWVAEVAAAFGVPLPTLVALAVAALAGALDLGRGPLLGGADLVGFEFGDRPLVALGGLPAALAQPPGDHDPVVLGEGLGQFSAWPRQA